MKQTLYLHIGFGKTGTSAIQGMLSSQADRLRSESALYPTTGIKGCGHHLLGKLGCSTLDHDTESLYKRLLSEISTSKCRTIILSSENFCFCHPGFIESLAQVFGNLDVKVIFYVRDQKPLIESVFLQWVKVGDDYRGGIDTFYQAMRGAFDFLQRIQPWVDVFGQQAIIARLYDSKIIGDDVCTDFIRLLDLDLGPDDYKANKVNPTLLAEFYPAIALIDKFGVTSNDRHLLVKELMQLSETFRPCAGASLLSESLKREIEVYFAQSNRAFAQRFLTSAEARLFAKSQSDLVQQ